jgi:hypothetical protein
MGTDELSEKERQVLEHLNHAKELGTPLTEFATAFHLNVNELYAGKAQLARKGFWPAKGAEAAKPDLLAVEVVPELKLRSPDTSCRLTHRSGWTIECTSWPAPDWVAALIGAMSRTGA